MRILISSNWSEQKGLAADGAILTRILQAGGHEVVPLQFDAHGQRDRGDLLIFLEVINPSFLMLAPRKVFFPNCEWFRPSMTYLLKQMDVVCCKTRDALRLMSPLTDQAVYTGFCSADHYQPAVPRRAIFLHNAGASQAKNTLAIMEAWARFGISYPLTIISDHFHARIPNVNFSKRIPKTDLLHLQNMCQFHIMPSEYEGFGMALNESLSVGAVVITGDWPPLSEFTGCPERLRVPSVRQFPSPNGIATAHTASPLGIKVSADICWKLTPDQLRELGSKARAAHLEAVSQFESRFSGLIGRLAALERREKFVPV